MQVEGLFTCFSCDYAYLILPKGASRIPPEFPLTYTVLSTRRSGWVGAWFCPIFQRGEHVFHMSEST